MHPLHFLFGVMKLFIDVSMQLQSLMKILRYTKQQKMKFVFNIKNFVKPLDKLSQVWYNKSVKGRGQRG